MKKMKFLLTLTLLFIFAISCKDNTLDSQENKKNTITVKHELGETTVTLNPEKIVVLDFGVLDTLDSMGVKITALPKKNIPKYLSKYEDNKYVNTGTLKEINYEKVNELKPDLIIISGRARDSYDELSKIAPTIYMETNGYDFINSFKNNINTLATIFPDKKEFLDTQVSEIENKIADLNTKVKNENLNALITLVNDGKMSVYGLGSRFGIIHNEFGFTPVDPSVEASTHGQNASFEYISEKNPDYLFVIDRSSAMGGDSGAKKILDNELINNTKAAKNNKIIYLNSENWYMASGGIKSTLSIIDEINNSLNIN